MSITGQNIGLRTHNALKSRLQTGKKPDLLNFAARTWLDKLENTEAEQHYGPELCIQQDNGTITFSPLGGAVELYRAYKNNTSYSIWLDGWYQAKDGTIWFADENEQLPPQVQHWLNLKTPTGEFTYNGVQTSLLKLNDGSRTFADFATIIRDHQDQLFKNPLPTPLRQIWNDLVG